MKNKNILISGTGIAGVTLAYWLNEYGFKPTLLESSNQFREGGYMIDFWGEGVDVADKMGILSDIEKQDLKILNMAHVNQDNKRRENLKGDFVRSLFNKRIYNVLRSNLAKILYKKIQGKVQCIFGNSIKTIEQNDSEVKVVLNDGTCRIFDLVIGSDGLHSNVRNLVFGPESEFEQFFGYYISSFTIDNYLKDEKVFYNYTLPNKQVFIYPIKNNQLAALFIFRSKEKIDYDRHDKETQKSILRNTFSSIGLEVPMLLEKMENAKDFFFDSVSQIKLQKWSKGRVCLVGDACYCPSLLSGQGASLAMTGAYILAGELKAAEGEYQDAFQKYEHLLSTIVSKKQKLAAKLAKTFIPKTKINLRVRNFIIKLVRSPFILKLITKRAIADKLILKEY